MVGHFYQKIAIKELDQSNVGYVSRHRPDHHLKPVGICLVLRFTFTFWCHFHFQQAKSTHLLSPRLRDSLVLMLKSLLLTFPSILVRTPSCLRILRTLRNLGNFEYFENFEEYEEKQKTSRLDPTIQHLGLPCLLTALPWNGIIWFSYKRGLIIIAFEKWIFLYYLSVRNLQTVPDSGLGGKDLTAPHFLFWIKSTASFTLRDWWHLETIGWSLSSSVSPLSCRFMRGLMSLIPPHSVSKVEKTVFSCRIRHFLT